MTNCYRAYGGVDESNFSGPLPLIGVYVAVASLVCTICMSIDLFRSLRWRKLWITSKFFSLNATTLTVLAVATKIPTDMTGAMPGLFDQLTKLSGVNLICITMNHAMPSLGVMDGNAIIANMVALGIFVITVFVNVRIQVSTGLITTFKSYIGVYSVTMLFIYLILVAHSLTVTTVKKLLEKQYNSKHKEIRDEVDGSDNMFSENKLREYVTKYWLMALTSSPDYALRSSGMSYASAILCWMITGVNFIRMMLAFLYKAWRNNHWGCYVRSDYSWSTGFILVIQTVAIVVGSLASFLRGMNSNPITLSSFTSLRALFKIEKYRMQKMVEWKEAPLPFHIPNRGVSKVAYQIKNLMVASLYWLQLVVIIMCKLFLLLSKYAVYIFLFLKACVACYLKKKACVSCTCLPSHEDKEVSQPSSNQELSKYVLYLEGSEEKDSNKIVQRFQVYPDRWIQSGKANRPTQLYNLLRNSTGEGFKGATELFSNNVHLFDSQELRNCWALPLVTLACIIRAKFTGREYNDSVGSLMSAVGESLRYVMLVDETLGENVPTGMRRAANMVWQGVDYSGHWLDVDLGSPDSKDSIRQLNTIAKKCFDEFGSENQQEWDPKLLAANCLYRVTETILQRHGGEKASTMNTTPVLFEQLRGIVVDVMGACLTNLPLAIFTHCSSGAFGEREERVRDAARMIGEADEILMWLEEKGRVEHHLYPVEQQYLDNWCMYPPT